MELSQFVLLASNISADGLNDGSSVIVVSVTCFDQCAILSSFVVMDSGFGIRGRVQGRRQDKGQGESFDFSILYMYRLGAQLSISTIYSHKTGQARIE